MCYATDLSQYHFNSVGNANNSEQISQNNCHCFIKFHMILQKLRNLRQMANCAAWLEILWPAENCGPYSVPGRLDSKLLLLTVTKNSSSKQEMNASTHCSWISTNLHSSKLQPRPTCIKLCWSDKCNMNTEGTMCGWTVDAYEHTVGYTRPRRIYRTTVEALLKTANHWMSSRQHTSIHTAYTCI